MGVQKLTEQEISAELAALKGWRPLPAEARGYKRNFRRRSGFALSAG